MSDNTGIPLPHLRVWRQSAYLSLTQLGILANVSREAILNIELGRNGARPTTIHKLAHALDITPQKLVEEPPS